MSAQPAGVRYRVAIVGAGPAGLSAAARAAALDAKAAHAHPTHILLEGSPAHAKTIQRYQKGKLVMAEPGFLDLRSDLRFAAGSREEILAAWLADYTKARVNIRLGGAVASIAGQAGDFAIQLTDGSTLAAETVILAIGLEGNPRKIGARGDDCAAVQYQLDDPKAYKDETILVLGAGDAAIENALALAEQNDVVLINRGKEFSRAKDANLTKVLAAITDSASRLECFYETKIKIITDEAGRSPRATVVLETPSGEKILACHRLIARLGAEPPRRFVESMGIRFPNARPDAIPELSRRYESNVPGIYIIGSLAGYPLIKQAMNQGYDVAEFVYGNAELKPADHQLIEWQFKGIPFFQDPDEALERFKARVPMFRELNALAFRELIIESDISVAYRDGPEFLDETRKIAALKAEQMRQGRPPRGTRVIREGDVIYEPGEFGTSFFTIVNGSVTLQSAENSSLSTQLTAGEFFGEMSLLSGRPRTERALAGPACVLVETPRRIMVKLMNSNEEVRKGIDWIFIVRELQRHFAPTASLRDLRAVAAGVAIRRYKAGELVFSQGEQGDSLFIIRSGGLSLSRRRATDEVLVAQVAAGSTVGEMALMGDPERRDTARATVATELIELKRADFLKLVRLPNAPLEALQDEASRRVLDNARMQVQPMAGSVMGFLMQQGLGEATDVLVIDETLCVGCDNCEKACAETHGGVSRLDREAGASFANVHIPIACRHCEQPHCMKDCPPNAIRRSPTGEVYINETCIGCGNCQKNCPYDVIRMVYEAPKKPGLLSWLLTGWGPGMGEELDYHPTEAAKAKGKKAVKCDACISVENGPACVKACPTGAALRIGPERFVDLAEGRRE
jgi:Fe-S-cluster-containing hydrogenase component 2/thioredoxin reductase/CRP-like cAMP-binding protein